MRKNYKKNVQDMRMNVRQLLATIDNTTVNDKLEIGLKIIEEKHEKLTKSENDLNKSLNSIL